MVQSILLLLSLVVSLTLAKSGTNNHHNHRHNTRTDDKSCNVRMPFVTGGASCSTSMMDSSNATMFAQPTIEEDALVFTEEEIIATPTTVTLDETEELETPNDENLRSLREEMQSLADKKGGPLKVLFLSADTGGGHRASAESLANQFQRHFPGTTYDLLDVWTPTNIFPYKGLVSFYKHLSAHPNHWKILYHVSNTRPYEIVTDIHSTIFCGKKIRGYMEEYDPDVVVSVHPTMNFVPSRVNKRIAKSRNKYIPFFTVVTDFGSAHCTWFQGNVDKMYVASERIRRLARRRSTITEEKLIMSGLPIRHDFSVQAQKMGDRTSEAGKEYRRTIMKDLDINPNKRMILVMGGGEGVGSLSCITEELYINLKKQGIDATICVVCGRNEKLREELNSKNWDEVSLEPKPKKEKKKGILRILQKKRKIVDDSPSVEIQCSRKGDVDVVGLGFINRMAEYMVAADVLVSKAGPGSIAEAAAVGLPVMLTSFLPGQEAGNVDIVLDGEFGAFCSEPEDIGAEVARWLLDENLMAQMSRNSSANGRPDAASEIVQDIGNITHEWMKKNTNLKK